jgi:hypothetical protein
LAKVASHILQSEDINNLITRSQNDYEMPGRNGTMTKSEKGRSQLILIHCKRRNVSLILIQRPHKNKNNGLHLLSPPHRWAKTSAGQSEAQRYPANNWIYLSN